MVVKEVCLSMSTYVAKYRGRRFYSTVSKTGFRGFDGFDQFITCQATCLQVSRLTGHANYRIAGKYGREKLWRDSEVTISIEVQ